MVDYGVVVRFGRRLNFMEGGYSTVVAETRNRRADHRLSCFADGLYNSGVHSARWPCSDTPAGVDTYGHSCCLLGGVADLAATPSLSGG